MAADGYLEVILGCAAVVADVASEDEVGLNYWGFYRAPYCFLRT